MSRKSKIDGELNGACAGFVYATACASSAVQVGYARNVLVVGAEKLTDYVDVFERSTGIIFADAKLTAKTESAAARPSLISGRD